MRKSPGTRSRLRPSISMRMQLPVLGMCACLVLIPFYFVTLSTLKTGSEAGGVLSIPPAEPPYREREGRAPEGEWEDEVDQIITRPPNRERTRKASKGIRVVKRSGRGKTPKAPRGEWEVERDEFETPPPRRGVAKKASGSRNEAENNSNNNEARPRVVSIPYSVYAGINSVLTREKHSSDTAPPKKRLAPWTEDDEERQKKLWDDEYYDDEDHQAEAPYEDNKECVPMHDWQTSSFPSCNALHQLDLADGKFVANGFFRDVWVIDDGLIEPLALKTLRLKKGGKHDFDERNFHRHRMDAISYERLTSSPYVMNIYGFCGQSGIFEYAPGGDLSDALSDNKLSKKDRFRVAIDVAMSISDLHNFNNKAPAIAHADIWHSQFVLIDGIYKLSDFNRCTFLYWNSTSNSGNCPYYYQHSNGYPFRSPEEYLYALQTEKIDVYSMGNVFYTLMMDIWPFEKLYKKKNTKAVSKLVKKGIRPELTKKLRKSTDPMDRALIKAMKMCYEQDWRRRATAKQVADFLMAEQEKIERDKLQA